MRQGRCLLYQLLLKKQCSVGKMAERIKVLADGPDPETYGVEGKESTPASCPLTFMHTSWYTHKPHHEYQIHTI